MALTNFYKGPEAEYSRDEHINGIYMSTDSNKVWIFGQSTQEVSDIISEDDYNALGTKDPNLLYIVKLKD
jgi:hypothetical protein